MIKAEKIKYLVEEGLDEGMFIVEISVSKANVINVFVDSMDGVTIDQCVAISRHIESNLDRETEDFELQVSSAGLGQPFKVIQQYYKNIGEDIEVIKTDGEKLSGILADVTEQGITVECEKKVKPEGAKRKQLVVEEIEIGFESIKSAKTIITF